MLWLSMGSSICLFVLIVQWTIYLCLPAFHAVRALIRNFASGKVEALNEINMMFFAVKKHHWKQQMPETTQHPCFTLSIRLVFD